MHHGICIPAFSDFTAAVVRTACVRPHPRIGIVTGNTARLACFQAVSKISEYPIPAFPGTERVFDKIFRGPNRVVIVAVCFAVRVMPVGPTLPGHCPVL